MAAFTACCLLFVSCASAPPQVGSGDSTNSTSLMTDADSRSEQSIPENVQSTESSDSNISGLQGGELQSTSIVAPSPADETDSSQNEQNTAIGIENDDITQDIAENDTEMPENTSVNDDSVSVIPEVMQIEPENAIDVVDSQQGPQSNAEQTSTDLVQAQRSAMVSGDDDSSLGEESEVQILTESAADSVQENVDLENLSEQETQIAGSDSEETAASADQEIQIAESNDNSSDQETGLVESPQITDTQIPADPQTARPTETATEINQQTSEIVEPEPDVDPVNGFDEDPMAEAELVDTTELETVPETEQILDVTAIPQGANEEQNSTNMLLEPTTGLLDSIGPNALLPILGALLIFGLIFWWLRNRQSSLQSKDGDEEVQASSGAANGEADSQRQQVETKAAQDLSESIGMADAVSDGEASDNEGSTQIAASSGQNSDTNVPLDIEQDLGADQPAQLAVENGSQYTELTEQQQEAANKLELAYAYQKMGDEQAALEILQEVISEGNDNQVKKAREAIANLQSKDG